MARALACATLVAVLLVAVLLPAALRAEDVSTLERRCQSFYAMLERGQRTKARGVWAALERDVSSSLARLQAELDREREAVIDRDGDLEALYASPSWREQEVASLVLTYHLAWVRYQGAQLTSDKKTRAALLRKAVEGFTQFTIVSEVPEIYAESLYGRGLSFMDLGEYRKAIADLEAAAGIARTKTKANKALVEARRLSGGGKAAKVVLPEDLFEQMKAALPKAARGDQKAEKKAMDLARGLSAKGRGWPEKVAKAIDRRTSFGLLVLGQIAIDRKRCGDLGALVAAGADVRDATRTRHRPELLYLQAGCTMNGGDPVEGARMFGALLGEFPTSGVAEKSAYYRFRALDGAEPFDATAQRAAADAYLERFGTTERSNEVRFLVAERLRGNGACDDARPFYDGVTRGSYAARATLGALECDVSTLTAETPAVERATVAAALRTFADTTPAKGDDVETVARAVLLGALVAASGNAPDHGTAAELLSGYEKRFPKQTAWHAMARETRVESLIAMGRLEDAESDVDSLLAADRSTDTTRLLGRIANDLARLARDGEGGDQTLARDLARRIWTTLAEADDPSSQLRIAELELDSGNADEARRLYESVLESTPDSAEARRGAARAAAASGDTKSALEHWKQVVEQSPSGGTAWYEARLAQIDLLVASDLRVDACQILRTSRGLSTTAGGDVLEEQLRRREPDVCR